MKDSLVKMYIMDMSVCRYKSESKKSGGSINNFIFSVKGVKNLFNIGQENEENWQEVRNRRRKGRREDLWEEEKGKIRRTGSRGERGEEDKEVKRRKGRRREGGK